MVINLFCSRSLHPASRLARLRHRGRERRVVALLQARDALDAKPGVARGHHKLNHADGMNLRYSVLSYRLRFVPPAAAHTQFMVPAS